MEDEGGGWRMKGRDAGPSHPEEHVEEVGLEAVWPPQGGVFQTQDCSSWLVWSWSSPGGAAGLYTAKTALLEIS